MVSYDWEEECPDCGEQMWCSGETDEPQGAWKECMNCGRQEHLEWVANHMSKSEVIQSRIDNEWRYDEYADYAKEEEEKGNKPLDFKDWTHREVFSEAV